MNARIFHPDGRRPKDQAARPVICPPAEDAFTVLHFYMENGAKVVTISKQGGTAHHTNN